MRFEVNHTTEFSYTEPVFLDPHDVRLRPCCDSRQFLKRYDFQVTPPPAGITENNDLNGNTSSRIWFNGTHDSLTIATAFTVDTLRTDPFDFVLDNDVLDLPVGYSDEDAEFLSVFRQSPMSSVKLTDFVESIREESKNETLAFLFSLNQRIHDTFEPILRPTGEPWAASATLRARKGACRDLAVLFITACRTVGLAARFVSGYHEGVSELTENEMHAWAEVFLPGAGWRGYDPMHGLVVADRHVVVATGHSPRAAAPTVGTFRGNKAKSKIRTQIDIKVTDTSSF